MQLVNALDLEFQKTMDMSFIALAEPLDHQPMKAQAKGPKVSPARTKKKAAKKHKAVEAVAKPKERKKMTDVALLLAADQPQTLIPQRNRDSLTAWLSLYMKIDGEACAEHTRIAKTQDLERFLDYFTSVVGSDSKKLWIFRPEDNQVLVGEAPAFFGEGKGASFLSDMKSIRKIFIQIHTKLLQIGNAKFSN